MQMYIYMRLMSAQFRMPIEIVSRNQSPRFMPVVIDSYFTGLTAEHIVRLSVLHSRIPQIALSLSLYFVSANLTTASIERTMRYWPRSL